MSSEHCAIKGIGAVTGYGWDSELLWKGLVSAKPAASLLSGYGDKLDELAWVAKVPEGGNLEEGPTRFARAMRAAAREAIEDAGARGWVPGRRVGLLHAIVLGDVDGWRDFYAVEHGRRSVRDYVALMPSTPMSTLMQEYGFHGPAMNVSAMCATGNAGLLTAKAWLDAGIVDDVVFITTDLSANQENLFHFTKLGVTITDVEPLEACRPFQEGSLGFIMGEASVGFVLSKRGGRSYTNIYGGAMTHDAHHATSIDPTLTHVRTCFTDALANSGVKPGDIRYLNAHGPGTAQCDRAEATMVDELLPSVDGMYSVKPLTGHCQGAASAVEIAVAAMGYERGTIPAPPRVASGHAKLINGVTPMSDGLTLKSSLGMGGVNTAVVLAPAA